MSNQFTRPSDGSSAFSTGVIILILLALAFAGVSISYATKIVHAVSEAKGAPAKPEPPLDQTADSPPAKPKGAETTDYLTALVFQEKDANGPIFVWSTLNFVICVLAAVWLANAPKRESAGEAQSAPPHKIVILTAGGLIGLATVIFLGLFQTILSWKTLTGSRENWKNQFAPWFPVIAMLVGLAIMFVSLLAVRSEERRSASLRRLLYGYNAFLCSLLLLGNLLVLNIMTFFYFTYSYDWTATGMFSLSGQSRQVVTSLDKPVKVYVIMSPASTVTYSPQMGQPQRIPLSELYRDLQGLLSAALQYSDKLQVEYLTWENPEKQPAISQLLSKYDILLPNGMPFGVLVVYDPDGAALAQFLGLEDLEKNVFSRLIRGGETRDFVGEQALVKTLVHLQEGGTRYMLLFTKGSGEMTLAPHVGGAAEGPPRSLSRLRSTLKERGGYECREFPLGEIEVGTNKPRTIPEWVRLKTPAEQQTLPYKSEDWTPVTEEEVKQRSQDKDRKYYRVLALVMADPQEAVNPLKVDALRTYLKEPYARLIAFLDVHRTSAGAVKPTGLEALLQEYAVIVGRDQVLQLGAMGERLEPNDPKGNPGNVRARVPAQAEPSLYVSMRNYPFLLQGARSVVAAPSRAYQARPLLATASQEMPHWMEKDPFKDPMDYLRQIGEAGIRTRLMLHVDQENGGFIPVTVAVTVQRPSPSAAVPTTPNAPPPPQVPFLTVFGDANLINDAQPFGGVEQANYLLFANTLGWLRGRKDIVTNEQPKVRTSYPISVPREQIPDLKPGFFLLIAIAAAGIGVALLRRR